ncbi:tRNA synthetases class I (M)-domain-containing protein [Rostrohypoxylon terebratum]|nr:tRNA synthetases class I (M)-domain-containing protein [Rostrohypoxylon terebratum]
MSGNLGILGRRLSTITGRQRVRNGWTCRSCRVSQMQRKLFSTSAALREVVDKPYYVSTPIFYVNSSPHVGHLYSMLIADVLKRWQVLKGKPAILSTGTDEHGSKVQQAAQLQELHPKALCDANSKAFRDLADKASIDYDFFIRTTDPEHKEAVEYFWNRLKEGGYIYESKHEGWYSVSDETYFPADAIRTHVSPMTGEPYMASIETGSKVEWQEEHNYHFRLTAFKERLLKFYEENPEFVVPRNRYSEVIRWVKNNLEDLSISRPRSRCEWGIPVPVDPEQVIYVWVDALINYITVAGYPIWPPGSEHTKGWPADVHVVGKDIVRFHGVYWPALLMALDLPLPKTVLCHGHWLMNKQKMSKSVGNVVNPFFAIERWGVDVMRYFLIYNGAMAKDSDYSNELIVERYKKLQRGLGNLLNRVVLPENWKVQHAVTEMCNKRLEIELPTSYIAQAEKADSLRDSVEEQMNTLQPSSALQEIMEVVYSVNEFLTNAKPWGMAEEEKYKLHQTIYVTAESLRIAGILLQPFMPQKMNRLLDALGVSHEKRTFEFAKLQADKDYGVPFVQLEKGAAGSLFPFIPVED